MNKGRCPNVLSITIHLIKEIIQLQIFLHEGIQDCFPVMKVRAQRYYSDDNSFAAV